MTLYILQYTIKVAKYTVFSGFFTKRKGDFVAVFRLKHKKERDIMFGSTGVALVKTYFQFI